MIWNKIFKRKSQVEKLNDKYDLLMKEAYKLSKINRTESDKKYLEADNVLSEIELLNKSNNG
tara:strand:+ start:1525 stop:1710 length:186 start_codon:yes stop_codon:yes gene_type:complete